ncbi:lipase family protein [Rubripirellula reticaptiva]|nr:lipase family protein [Rubripirellula reticaptiva]
MADPIYSLSIESRLAESWDGKQSVDWDRSASLALLSKTAYDDDLELMKFTAKGMGFDDCKLFEKRNSAGHALIGTNVVLFAFRGTEFTSLADWKTDAYAQTVSVTGVGEIHSGFNTAYEYLRSDVERVIRENPGKTIWVTGHSLGGAMAVICAMRCKQSNLGNVRIITFGQPRVGNNSTARWIDSNFSNSYQRFVNDQDLVPRLPPARFFQYADAGKFIIVGQGSVYGAVAGGAGNDSEKIVYTVDAPQLAGGSVDRPRAAYNSNATNSDLTEVYQTRNTPLPLTGSELDLLIQAEVELKSQAGKPSLFFPDKEGEPELRVGSFGAPGAIYGGIYGTKEKFTDHQIAGYLAVIRKSRDE